MEEALIGGLLMRGGVNCGRCKGEGDFIRVGLEAMLGGGA